MITVIHTFERNYNNYWSRNRRSSKQEDERNKRVIFKNFAPITNSITETNNTQTDNIKEIDFAVYII